MELPPHACPFCGLPPSPVDDSLSACAPSCGSLRVHHGGDVPWWFLLSVPDTYSRDRGPFFAPRPFVGGPVGGEARESSVGVYDGLNEAWGRGVPCRDLRASVEAFVRQARVLEVMSR